MMLQKAIQPSTEVVNRMMTTIIQVILTPQIWMKRHPKQRTIPSWAVNSKKYTLIIKRDSIGTNSFPELCQESHASLNRDIKEQVKVSSTDLAINDIWT